MIVMIMLRCLNPKGYVCYAVANACDEREETRDGMVSAPFLFGGRVPSSEDLPTVVDPHFKGFRGGGFVADP